VEPGPFSLHDTTNSSLRRYTFTGNLDSPFPASDKVHRGRRVPFTIRYRVDPNSEWQWVYHNFGIADGELILQPPVDPNFLGVTPIDLQSGWSARKLISEAPDARLYAIESSEPIPPAPEGEDARQSARVLGRVLQLHRWFALVRIWSPWLGPRHGENRFHLSEPAILVSFLRSDGLHVVLLAINGIDDVLTTISSSSDGEIVIQARNDTTKDRKFKVLTACAWKFEVALASVMYEMRKQVRSSPAYLQSLEHFPKELLRANSISSESSYAMVTADTHVNGTHADTPTPQWLESWYDNLAYCTWNGLGQDLNGDKITHAMQSLSDAGVNVSTLIIDDNWQSLTGKQGETNQFERGWTRFEANAEGFPNGLKAFITDLRAKFPHLKDVAVWHALMGYWGLIAPSGTIAQDYNTQPITIESSSPAGGAKTAVSASAIHAMYDDFYSFLSSAGITGVKTDVQFYLDTLSHTSDRRALTLPYMSAWTQAHLRHLSGKAISCMSMIPQILFHSFLPTTTPRILLRTSDDFFPDVESSHPWHVFCNAHNAVFVQHLNCLPDWDMFQTKPAEGQLNFAGLHAAARCVSGGPIYITDEPGRHDVGLIEQMSARSVRGERVILRASTVGKTMGVYDRYEERGVLKVGAYHGRAESGVGILGVFNMSEKELAFLLPVTKFPGCEGEDEGLQSPSRRGSEHESLVSRGMVGNGGSRPASGPSSAMGDVERKWVVRSHASGKITRPLSPTVPLESGGLLQCKLPRCGYDVWAALPVQMVQLGDGGEVEIAVLGLLGKFTGACAIVSNEAEITQNGKCIKINVALKALGVLGVWINDSDGEKDQGHERWQKDKLMVMISGQAIPAHCVEVSAEGIAPGDTARVLKVDVLRAWDEMSIDPGWSNEARVEILVS
jgi:hypothetical protein